MMSVMNESMMYIMQYITNTNSNQFDSDKIDNESVL